MSKINELVQVAITYALAGKITLILTPKYKIRVEPNEDKSTNGAELTFLQIDVAEEI